MNDKSAYLQRAINRHFKTTGVLASESLSECVHGEKESVVMLRDENGHITKYIIDNATGKMRRDVKIISVSVPLHFTFLAGRVGPTRKQARLLRPVELYGGLLDGKKIYVPNMVDWSRSQVDLSPLIPWLGNPDSATVDQVMKRLCAKWPELKSQLEVIRLEVEASGEPCQWGDLVQVRVVEPRTRRPSGRDLQ